MKIWIKVEDLYEKAEIMKKRLAKWNNRKNRNPWKDDVRLVSEALEWEKNNILDQRLFDLHFPQVDQFLQMAEYVMRSRPNALKGERLPRHYTHLLIDQKTWDLLHNLPFFLNYWYEESDNVKN
jgi:hypothetical protein